MQQPEDPVMSAIDRLRSEGQQLEDMLSDLPEEMWHLETPATGWTIAHQIAHLAWTDRLTITSLRDARAFQSIVEAASHDPVAFINDAAEEGAQRPPAQLIKAWAVGRRELAKTFASADQDERFPWFGPAMKIRSLVTARIMETWAHGQDVARTLEKTWEPTAALKDIAHLGYITRDFAYFINGLSAPTTPLYLALEGPRRQIWTWGNANAENQIRGSAWDFALLVTQRAEIEQLTLTVCGSDARTWATIAQAFAGPPKAEVRAKNSNQSN